MNVESFSLKVLSRVIEYFVHQLMYLAIKNSCNESYYKVILSVHIPFVLQLYGKVKSHVIIMVNGSMQKEIQKDKAQGTQSVQILIV